jgi:hypothetical protein
MPIESVIKVRILSIEENLRNPSLIQALRLAFPDFDLDLEIVRGLDGRVTDCTVDHRINFNASRRVLGRDLTSGEAACMLGHHRMQTEPFSRWLLILEDDARLVHIDGLQDFYVSHIRSIDSSPVVCTLFKGLYGLPSVRSRFSRSNQLNKLVKPSTGTVAYFVNEEACDLICLEKQIAGVADWPTWIHKVNFYESRVGFFDSFPLSDSLITPQILEKYSSINPTFRTNLFQALLGLLNHGLVKDFGGYQCYLRGVILPFIYKLIITILPNNHRY